MDRKKKEDLVIRSDMLCSLAWLGMDVTWTFWSSAVGGFIGLVACVTAILSFFLVEKPADRFLYASCVFWILMDQTWLLNEFAPFLPDLLLPKLMALAALVTILVAFFLYLKERSKGEESNYLDCTSTLTWLLMDIAWMFELPAATLLFGILTFVFGTVAVIRSENLAVRLINASMLCWVTMNLSELATYQETCPSVTLFSNPILASLVLVFFLSGMIKSQFDSATLAIFRRVRFSSHKKTIDTISVMPPSPFTIVVNRKDTLAEIRIAGRLDSLTYENYLKVLMAEADAGARTVVVDAAELNYISSMGLRALLSCHKHFASLGGTFKIGKISSQSLQIILMAGMDLIVEKH